MTNHSSQSARDPFKRMTPEAHAAIVAAVEQVFGQAKATIAAFILQLDDEEPKPVIVDTDREFRDRHGYPASWDAEVSQPRKRPDPAGMIEAMLRNSGTSSDEMDAGLFEGSDHD